MSDTDVKVGQLWVDNDPRMSGRTVKVTEVDNERVYYESYPRGTRKANSDLKRFTKAFSIKE